MDNDTSIDEGKDEDTNIDESKDKDTNIDESKDKDTNIDEGKDIDAAKPKKKKMGYKAKMRLLYSILAVAIAAAVTCGVWIFVDMNTTRQAQEYYESLTEGVVKNPRNYNYVPGLQVPTNTPDTTNPGDDDPEAVWIPYVDFDALNAQYQPVTAAWLVIEGTVIDYPVMYRQEDRGIKSRNDDYFLRRLPDGTSHRNGSLYIDQYNSPDFTDKNTVIYGHNMKSGDMFGSLKEYRNQEYFDQHPVVYIYTPDRDFILLLFAGYNLDSAYEVPPIAFSEGSDEFISHIENIRRRSVFKSDVEVSEDDRIVSLATCAVSSNRNERLILVGKLVELGGR